MKISFEGLKAVVAQQNWDINQEQLPEAQMPGIVLLSQMKWGIIKFGMFLE
jgi:hypothetical protein